MPPRVPGSSRRARTIAPTLFLLALAPAPAVAAPEYGFVSIFEVAEPISSVEPPALNDDGVVAFFAYLSGGGQAICRADPNGIDMIADTVNGPFVSFTGVGSLQMINRPDLDNAGRVIYRAYLFEPPMDYHVALFLDDGVTRLPLTEWGPAATHRLDWSDATINGAGLAAFTAWTDGVLGVTLATASGYEVPVDESDGFQPTFAGASVSPGGDVAFSAVTLGNEDGLFAVIDGALHVLARTGVDLYSHSTTTSMNDLGRIVFRGQPEEFVDGILSATVDSVWTIADDLNGEIFEFGEVAINNSGLVVYHARLSGYQQALLVGPNPVTDALLRTGQPLFGSICNDLAFTSGGLNEYGQVAFYYSLEDGRSGIAIGTPAPIGVAEGGGPGGSETISIWPNPSTGCIRFRVTIPGTPMPSDAEILDVTGRLVRRLGRAEWLPSSNGWTWDGRTAAGAPAVSGVYYLRVPDGGRRPTSRFVLSR